MRALKVRAVQFSLRLACGEISPGRASAPKEGIAPPDAGERSSQDGVQLARNRPVDVGWDREVIVHDFERGLERGSARKEPVSRQHLPENDAEPPSCEASARCDSPGPAAPWRR